MGFNGILGPCPSSKCLQACLAIILKTVLHAYDSFLVALQKLGVSRKVWSRERLYAKHICLWQRSLPASKCSARHQPGCLEQKWPIWAIEYWHNAHANFFLWTTIPCIPLNYDYSHWAFDSLSQYEVIWAVTDSVTDFFGQTSIPKITCSRRTRLVFGIKQAQSRRWDLSSGMTWGCAS